MKIKSIQAFAVNLTPHPTTPPRVPAQATRGFVHPMLRYADRPRPGAANRSKRVACVVTAEDGTWGLGFTSHSGPVEHIINNQFAQLLVGEDCMAIEKMWDMMQRSTSSYGTAGLASYAISAVDLALWDLKGKLLGVPVYALLGGPQKEKIFCYVSNTNLSFGTEHSIAWFLELGFKAVKIFLQHGADAGLDGLRHSEEMVARTREQIGDSVELMVDAWISFDVEHVVRLAEMLRPYRIKWLEDYVKPDDLESYARVRQRLPTTTLATGEHWYSTPPFAAAAGRGLVDIFQPDLSWVGGITAGVRICHLAEAHGQTVITHGGANYPWGQHMAMAMPSISWGERIGGDAAPGVPLEEIATIPGTVTVRDGYVRPTDAPGFGYEVTKEWLEKVAL